MAENYEILLGVRLDTDGLKEKINSLNNKYKLDLGVDVKTNEIRKQISQYNGNSNNAKLHLKVKLDDTDIKRQIKELGKTKTGDNLLKLNTDSLEKSLNEVNSTIKEIRTTLSSLDNVGDLSSIVGSVNQIGTALDKASGKIEEFGADLKALANKEFGFNIGLDMGQKGLNTIGYGRAARKQVIPELEAQIKYLENLHGGQQAVMKKLAQNKNIGFDIFADFNDFNSDSAIKKMEAMEKYINSLKKLATIDNVDLSGFNDNFSKSASELINDITGVENAVDKAEDTMQKLKGIFGGSVDGDNLTRQLDSVVTDLGEIKTAIQGLSKGVSIDGLTQSFDRLNSTLDKLVSNLSTVKNTLNSELTGVDVGTNMTSRIEQESNKSTNVAIQNEKRKQQAYKATTDTVMYHAGVVAKLNKAETNGRFYGSNRGTGYFGTGHYFVDFATKHELDNNSSYNKLPYTSIDISQYDNLFKATNDEIAGKLHNFLANLTAFTQGSDSYNISELFVQFKSVFGDTIMDIKEFGSRLDQLKTFMVNSSIADRSDSVSTQFMKSLGYGGVDTRGTKYADTRYGTVIYDLKEESILQANITDELQKQGQMLEKISYEKGQVFDKSEDNRIQNIIYEQAKQKEIMDEYKNSFNSTNLDKTSSELEQAKNRLAEIDDIIANCQNGINNAEKEALQFAKTMKSLGIEMSDDEINEHVKYSSEEYRDRIEELTKERVEIQSKIPVLEEVYNKEEQLSIRAFEQAKETVEQRKQQAQEVVDIYDNISFKNISDTGFENVESSFNETASIVNNLDDVIDKEVLSLMETFSIAGDKGSNAFKEIKQALVECRNELNILKNIDIGIDEEVFDTSRAFDKVSDAIANQMRAVNSLGDEYVELAKYMTNFNDPTKGNKVRIPDFIKQEQGDDYKSSRGTLGIAFNTERGIPFADFINDLNHELGLAIDLTKGEEKAYEELVHKLRLGREQLEAQKKSLNSSQANASTDEILAQNYINKNEIRDEAESAIDYINATQAAAEAMAQSSAETTNAVVRNEERKQQAYRETANSAKNIDKLDTFKDSLRNIGMSTEEIDAVSHRINSLGVQIETLNQKTSRSKDNSVLSVDISGLDELGNAITLTRQYDMATGDLVKAVERVSTVQQKAGASAEKFAKQQKQAVSNLTNQINQINRAAIDQNASRPIKDTAHLDALESKYNEITSAIQRMENASSDTFVDEQNNVRKLITEFKSLVSEYRNAENVASKMKGTDFGSGLKIAKNNLEKFKAEAKGFPQIVNTIKDLDKAIEGIGDASSLNKFNDQLRVARSELAKIKSETSAANKVAKLNQDKIKFSLQIDNWLKDNSAAAKDFGTRIRELQRQINACDKEGLGNLKREFQSIKQEAKLAGKTTQTFVDRIKTQFSKYSAYFGIAEIFMYAEQGLRDMFEQVKLIDSAMTELKKVTDESDSTYNQFLTNAASRAKEIGTTIDGLISSTADFARLGYDFADAQGLAEVANIYTVVGDEIEGVEGATQSLISTMAAFKDEMNGMSDADFAMDIVDKFNEVDILAS